MHNDTNFNLQSIQAWIINHKKPNREFSPRRSESVALCPLENLVTTHNTKSLPSFRGKQTKLSGISYSLKFTRKPQHFRFASILSFGQEIPAKWSSAINIVFLLNWSLVSQQLRRGPLSFWPPHDCLAFSTDQRTEDNTLYRCPFFKDFYF